MSDYLLNNSGDFYAFLKNKVSAWKLGDDINVFVSDVLKEINKKTTSVNAAYIASIDLREDLRVIIDRITVISESKSDNTTNLRELSYLLRAIKSDESICLVKDCDLNFYLDLLLITSVIGNKKIFNYCYENILKSSLEKPFKNDHRISLICGRAMIGLIYNHHSHLAFKLYKHVKPEDMRTVIVLAWSRNEEELAKLICKGDKFFSIVHALKNSGAFDTYLQAVDWCASFLKGAKWHDLINQFPELKSCRYTSERISSRIRKKIIDKLTISRIIESKENEEGRSGKRI